MSKGGKGDEKKRPDHTALVYCIVALMITTGLMAGEQQQRKKLGVLKGGLNGHPSIQVEEPSIHMCD